VAAIPIGKEVMAKQIQPDENTCPHISHTQGRSNPSLSHIPSKVHKELPFCCMKRGGPTINLDGLHRPCAVLVNDFDDVR